MDFDVTDIYGMQSEGTVKKDGLLCKVRTCIFRKIKCWMKHVNWLRSFPEPLSVLPRVVFAQLILLTVNINAFLCTYHKSTNHGIQSIKI